MARLSTIDVTGIMDEREIGAVEQQEGFACVLRSDKREGFRSGMR